MTIETPSDLVRERRLLSDWFMGPVGLAYRRSVYDRIVEAEGPIKVLSFDEFARSFWQCYHHGDLYLVVPDMTVLSTTAAVTLPDTTTFTTEDAPSLTGLMLFRGGEPIGYTANVEPLSPVYAVAWGLDETGCLMLEALTWRDDAPWLDDVPRDALARLAPLLVPCARQWVPKQPEGVVQAQPWAKATLAAFLLMQQQLPAVSEGHIERAVRRSAKRHGTASDVKVVTLRRAQQPNGRHDHDAVARDWSHQWIVGGHWRNHWYPKRETHRPRWIAPHVKGPADKPLVVKETVKVWAR